MYGIQIDRESKLTVTRQICQQLRRIIESGQLTAGTRLLPTRVLAKEWGLRAMSSLRYMATDG